MPVLIPKAGVEFARIAPAGGAILAAAGVVALQMRRDLTITSGTDSHPSDDPHARGEAFDLSVQGMSEAEILTLVESLKSYLGPKFTVLYECPTRPNGVLGTFAYVNAHATAPHVHAQYQKGLTFTLDAALAAKGEKSV